MVEISLVERNLTALADREPGDIIFFRPASFKFFASAILFVTGEYYHHGAIVSSDTTAIIESDPLVGVHISSVSEYLGDYYLDLYRLKDNSSAPQIAEFAKTFVGWRYDYGNVLWAGIGYIWYRLTGINLFRRIRNPADEAEAVDSEEFIDMVFRRSGINLTPHIPSTNASAQTLADSDLLAKISPF